MLVVNILTYRLLAFGYLQIFMKHVTYKLVSNFFFVLEKKEAMLQIYTRGFYFVDASKFKEKCLSLCGEVWK